MNNFCVFVEHQRDETLEVTEAILIYNKDPFLQIRQDVTVRTPQQGPAKKDVEGDEEGKEDEGEEEEKGKSG